MIINHEKEWLYLGPPKTGSTTLHRFLSQDEQGGQYLTTKVQHDFDVPPQCRDYFIFCSIRHPYPRAVSLWYHYLRDMRRKETQELTRFERKDVPLAVKRMPFIAFANLLVGNKGEDFYRFTINRWLKWVKRVDRFINMENLNAEFNELPFVEEPVELPRFNSPGRPPCSEVYSAVDQHLIDLWGAPDFFRFGFDHDLEDVT